MSDREERQAQAKLEAQAERDDYMAVLGMPAGRRLLARILRRCAIAEPAFSSDPLVMAHNEGRRSIGIELSADIRTQSTEHWRQVRSEMDQ